VITHYSAQIPVEIELCIRIGFATDRLAHIFSAFVCNYAVDGSSF